jgi:hypothetical protein
VIYRDIFLIPPLLSCVMTKDGVRPSTKCFKSIEMNESIAEMPRMDREETGQPIQGLELLKSRKSRSAPPAGHRQRLKRRCVHKLKLINSQARMTACTAA